MAEQLQLLGLVLLSMILGAAVGFEREAADKPAGLRTHMLVAGAATLLTGLSELLVTNFDAPPGMVMSDPIRLISAVVTGISFLGAGTIIRDRGDLHVEGLTTAASLLFVAALGIGVAQRLFLLTIGGTLMVLLTVGGLRWLERRINLKDSSALADEKGTD